MKLKSIIGITLTLLVTIIGLIFISYYSFYASGSFYGYEGYCRFSKLNYFRSLILFEIAGIFAFLAFYIIQEFFNLFKGSPKLYIGISLCVILNLTLITLQIIQYPYLLRKFGFLGQSGEGELYNPLIYIAAFYIVIFIWWSYRFSKKSNLIYAKVFYSIVVLSLSAIVITALNFKYEICRG